MLPGTHAQSAPHLRQVAKDPQTLALLVELLRELIADEQTRSHLLELVVCLLDAPALRTALIELLQQTFRDEALSRETGRFLLAGLDTSEARAMLDTQTARLVSATVLDKKVQENTGEGVASALKHALMPRWLWRGGR